MKNRQILHVDMNSFFATAEQQANPVLRGRPVGVRGSKSERTIIVASSIEAKRLGIKTGYLVHEAKKICPEIEIITGEPRKYSYILKSLVRIFERYSNMVEIFSIDECFIDVTNSANLFADKKPKGKHQAPNNVQINSNTSELNSNLKFKISNYSGAINITKLIKKDIKDEIGEWMICSVGIAENKFLAKLASDFKKPDGLVVITPNYNKQIPKNKQIQNLNTEAKMLTVDEALLSSDLSDFCGIGKRINSRLKKIGIRNVKDLREAPDWLLKKEFGVYGFKMKNWAYGIDNSKVVPHQKQKEAKSFSKARTLNKDVTSKKELEKTLYLLCESLGKRMRREKYWGNNVGLWVRYSSFNGTGETKKIGRWICDGHEIFNYSKIILTKIDLKFAVRAIGVSVSSVQPEKNIPRVIFKSEKTEEKIIETIDLVNNKYGDFSLVRASVSKMKIKEVVSGMGRKKLFYE